jgi:hypothetical protein
MIMEAPGASTPAGAGRARPAAVAQQAGYVTRGLASMIAEVEKPEPKREKAADRIDVVAPLVTPLLLGWVRRGPVESTHTAKGS